MHEITQSQLDKLTGDKKIEMINKILKSEVRIVENLSFNSLFGSFKK